MEPTTVTFCCCNIRLPDRRHIAGEFFIFQQDSAPTHRAPETILNARVLASSRRMCGLRTATTSVQLIYKIWGLTQQRVFQTKVQNVFDLRQRVIDVWTRMEQAVIDDAIDQWRRRLRSCVQAKGSRTL